VEVRSLPAKQPPLAFFDAPSGPRLAYRLRQGRSPALLFLPGYASDMDGSKALALDDFAARRGHALVRFDYSGTGHSGGCFQEGTLDRWLAEAELMLDQLLDGPVILVGSSMGGWIALHLTLRRPERVEALVGVAAAPDFTEWGFTEDDKSEIERSGKLERPNPYGGDSQLTTRAFWASGQALRLLEREIAVDCPVRLIHGDADQDVPLGVAFRTVERLRSADVQLNILKGGGHRLSEPHEIEAILRTVAALLEPSP
jgi:pimeloyl-ACP methyl ester carboxylesterase